ENYALVNLVTRFREPEQKGLLHFISPRCYNHSLEKECLPETGRHNVFGTERIELPLQLIKQNIDKAAIAGLPGNLGMEGHLRELIENVFEVAVIGDATALTILPGQYGNQATQPNIGMISNYVQCTKTFADAVKKSLQQKRSSRLSQPPNTPGLS
ncbi:MAG: hypothetical protein R3281_13540, partial [Balneolaceae bacterium]|nr:hypothetical protein [Balneolaceae bacterium]